MIADLYVDATPRSTAYVIKTDKTTLYNARKLPTKLTVNEAEYQALSDGIYALRDQCIDEVHIYSDSELMVKQILGRYKVRKNLLPFWREVMHLLAEVRWSLDWIPGKENPADVHSRAILWDDTK